MTEIMNKMRTFRWQTLVIVMLVAMVTVGTESCKSTGKLSKKDKKAQIEMYKKQLQEIVNGTSKLSLEDQMNLISEAANKNFNNDELNALILQAQAKTKAAYGVLVKEQQQKVEEARTALYDLLANKDNLGPDELQTQLDAIKARKISDSEITELQNRVQEKIDKMRNESAGGTIKSQLEAAFQAIVDAAKAGNTDMANQLIKGTSSKYFASDDTPVLIIISKEGSIIDYDKPTTALKYLNFVKDQKASRNSVDTYVLDGSGKIKELDLIKK
jgi:hypothetical protein